MMQSQEYFVPKDAFLTEKDVAARLNIPVATIRSWRFNQIHFHKHYKIGELVRYSWSELEAYLNTCRRPMQKAV